MFLTILRHGEAAPGEPDRERRLTPRGERDLRRAATAYPQQLRARGIPLPEQVYFSPWERAVQTAGYLAEAVGAPAQAAPVLTADQSTRAVEELLAAAPAPRHALLVSHQPLVGRLIDRWLGDGGEVPGLVPGAYAVLRTDVPGAGCASFCCWSGPPDYAL